MMPGEQCLRVHSDLIIVDKLARSLERLYSGGGEMGVYTVAAERDQLRPLLLEFMRRCRSEPA